MSLKRQTLVPILANCFACVVLSFSTWAVDDLGPKVDLFHVKKVEVRGLKKVEQEAVLEKIGLREGMQVDNYVLRKDIQKIYSMKYFDWVEAQQEGDNLIFVVKEKPIITKLKVVGNNDIDFDDLKGQIKTKEFAILDVNTVKSDVAALQKYYEEKGYYLASIDYELKKINEENTELIFNVKEFDKVRVKKINFLGNNAFSDEQLKDIMETREDALFAFMNNSGNFKEFNFQTDVERLKYFYKTKGYLQVNVGTPEITVSEDKKWVFIAVKVQEGPQFTINDITFQGELLFPEEKLMEKLTLKKEKTYSEELLRNDIQALTEMYQDEGYAFANVLRTLHVVPGENKVDVEFSFEKGKIAYFGKIHVKGNSKTRDKVIRRELQIKEGVRFSGSALRISKENVNRLGFFEPNSVVFNTVSPKGKDDVLDVEISVKERNTGQISLGAGYSTATGAFLNASISQNNFQGLGQTLSFGLTLANTQKTFNLGFTEPYLFDTQWTAGADIFQTQNSSSNSYSYKSKGFDLRVGHPVWDYTRLFVTYKMEDTQIQDLNDPTLDAETENGLSSSINTNLVLDKRDNKYEPTKGIYTSVAAEYAGLGGDKYWYKSELDSRYYYNVIGDLVFRSRLYSAKLEQVDGHKIPRTEKFTLGGSRNLRGYTYEAIGPQRTVADNTGFIRTFNEGGLFTAFTQVEFEHPLAREAGLKWVVFFDAGNVYQTHIGENKNYNMKMDYGFGFRWFSPIGVLRFEWGKPINPEVKDAGSQFHFDIGQLF